MDRFAIHSLIIGIIFVCVITAIVLFVGIKLKRRYQINHVLAWLIASFAMFGLVVLLYRFEVPNQLAPLLAPYMFNTLSIALLFMLISIKIPDPKRH